MAVLSRIDEFISPEVTDILSLYLDRPICYGTNIEGAVFQSGRPESKLIYYVTSEHRIQNRLIEAFFEKHWPVGLLGRSLRKQME